MMKKGIKIAVFFSLTCLITACAQEYSIEPSSGEHLKLTQQDKTYLDDLNQDALPATITVETAIKRALDKNLDAYVSSLETVIASDNVNLQKLAALPNINGSANFIERSDEAASSSESVITRTQSLEPSTSTDQEKRTAGLTFQWNLLDASIAFLQGKIAENNELVALERLKKIKQNIERDVTASYWRAYTHQQNTKKLETISTQMHDLLNRIETAQNEKLFSIEESTQKLSATAEKTQTLNNLREEIRLADVELRSLAALPLDGSITLSGKPSAIEARYTTLLSKDINALIDQALRERPEIRENIANRNIAAEEVKREILNSFPGLGVIYGLNYDSNSFLVEQNWQDLNVSLTQSITSFLTLPKRYKQAKQRKQLIEAQRLALTAAIIAQIHVSKLHVQISRQNYETAQKLYRASQKQALLASSRRHLSAASSYEELSAKADSMIQEIQTHIAYADLQRAYADLLGSLGQPLYPDISLAEGGKDEAT